jgi:hypothetical protein
MVTVPTASALRLGPLNREVCFHFPAARSMPLPAAHATDQANPENNLRQSVVYWTIGDPFPMRPGLQHVQITVVKRDYFCISP